jgi:hypothetical protein
MGLLAIGADVVLVVLAAFFVPMEADLAPTAILPAYHPATEKVGCVVPRSHDLAGEALLNLIENLRRDEQLVLALK